MFSSALKSFSSNISGNYTIAPQPSSQSGPWKIFDAKHKSTKKAASVFVFDKKALEPQGGGLGGRGNAASLRRAHEEVLERLKKEASSLARLRHPSILELAEPVEETRSGGLMFATEAVTASLASLLHEKDEQERSGGVGGRGSRYVVEEADGTKKRRELEIDELEIQKGLLQLGKGLEFLHESAGLVHANLTPEAIMVNAKGDWKISGFGYAGPHESSTAASSFTAISLHEVLNHDPRLPRSVQLNVDYTSPDFVLDNSLTASADIFSLGLIIVALYNSPHSSPISTGGSTSSYKRVFASSSSIPTQSNDILVPSSSRLPAKLKAELLPRLITRRPAQRLSAKEFQEASYFDNILVSTIRFLDALPAKTANEKAQFMRGLPRIMPQFPKNVLEKKVLPALLEETKDKELIAPIMTNVFAMVKAMPTGKRAFTDQVVPKLREIFVVKKDAERDSAKEAGLMILLENMETTAESCAGKEFRENILPIIGTALESPTHGIVDAALSTLPFVLPVLDFSTIKNELFPVIANVFAKTSSLNIKIRGLEAFYTLCGGSASVSDSDDDINGIGIADKKKSASSSAILDKFTVQEKIVPLLKGIKTKEPGVMMAALRVFKQVGEVADTDYLAMDVLPVLWSMSLGPLLNLQQFQSFMNLIKSLSSRIEREQTRKLQELSSSNAGATGAIGGRAGKQNATAASAGMNGLTNGDEADFESLVSGRKATGAQNNDLMNDWGTPAAATARQNHTNDTQPAFSWQSNAPAQNHSMNGLRAQTPVTRAITPDQTLSSFATLTPASQYSQPLQPNRGVTPAFSSTSNTQAMPVRPPNQPAAPGGTSIDWSTASSSNASAWSNQRATPAQTKIVGATGRTQSGFAIPHPPMSPPVVSPSAGQQSFGAEGVGQGQGQKKGLGHSTWRKIQARRIVSSRNELTKGADGDTGNQDSTNHLSRDNEHVSHEGPLDNAASPTPGRQAPHEDISLGGDSSQADSTLQTTPKPKEDSSKYFTEVVSSLCSNSIITFISNELPALRAHLTDDHLQMLYAFVNSHFDQYTKHRDPSLTSESSFLFKNSLSVCAKLYLPLLRETRVRQMVPIRWTQLAGEVARLEGARELEGLIVEREKGLEKRAAIEERKSLGGIEMVDGKVLHGPARAEDEDSYNKEGEDDGGIPPGMMFVNQDLLASWGRMLAKKK